MNIRSKVVWQNRYPWWDMRVGDHFDISAENGGRARTMKAAHQRNWSMGHCHKFSCSTLRLSNGARVTRVTRIK